MLKFVLFALAVSASHATVDVYTQGDANLVSSIKNYPYLLSIEYYGEHICSATIISSTHAVVASHCIMLGFEAINVRAGSSKILSGGTVVKIKKVFAQPGQNGVLDKNLAVLELSEPLVFNETIQKIAIARKGYVVPTNIVAKTIGWGPTHLEGEVVLQSVDVEIVKHKECRKHYDRNTMTERMICGKSTVCHDDAGGPLVYENTLIGFYSWGRPCDPYSIYLDIAVVRDFITEYAGI